MTLYNKAIAAVLVPSVLMVLQHFGVTPDMPVSEAVEVLFTALLTALAVFLVPNR